MLTPLQDGDSLQQVGEDNTGFLLQVVQIRSLVSQQGGALVQQLRQSIHRRRRQRRRQI